MPALSGSTLRVSGYNELQRAFAGADKKVRREFRAELRKVAEPVALDAEHLSVDKIRNIDQGDAWSRMRVGITRRVVYVAPVERGRLSRRNPKLRRPNLAPLMLDRAMDPALDRNASRIEHEFDNFLGRVADKWGSA